MPSVYLWFKVGYMAHIVTKRTTKRQRDAILKRAVKRSRRKGGAAFSDLLGKAPLHTDPVKFQRALRDEQ
jgi:hypothetical protein